MERLRLDMVESRGRGRGDAAQPGAHQLAAAEMRARGEEVLRIREEEAQHEVAPQRLAEAVRGCATLGRRCRSACVSATSASA